MIREHTITGADWVRALRRARERQRPAARLARISGGFVCPVCGRVGVHQPQPTGGALIAHGGGLRCWQPAAPAGEGRAA